ncbi:MAG: NAD-dependent epimerase/dehydratase family protein, partial [Cyanobacteria bacterium REEB65]|nr:NAD-dependent epimerase/dehydratase family protein [Cyanobacteria bacterium REEB65]
MRAQIILTGATGFLGKALVTELLGSQARVVAGRGGEAPERPAIKALGRRPNPDLAARGIEVATGSLLDDSWLLEHITPRSTVVHMAGRVEFTAAGVREMHELHVESTRRIAHAALAKEARLVLLSSSGTTAISRHDGVIDETASYPMDLVSKWPYYLTKTLAERLVLDLHRSEGLEAVVVNPSLLLGPGDDRHGSTA